MASTSVVMTVSPPGGAQTSAAKIDAIDRLRAQSYNLGLAQVFFALFGMFAAFNYISNSLSLAVGIVCLVNWKSLDETLKYYRGNSPCCSPFHLRGLCISTIVFSILEGVGYGFALPTGVFLLSLSSELPDGDDADSARHAVGYVGLAFIAGFVLSVLDLVLAAVQLCTIEALDVEARRVTGVTAVSSGMAVLSYPMYPAMPGQGYAPQYMVPGYGPGQGPQGQYMIAYQPGPNGEMIPISVPVATVLPMAYGQRQPMQGAPRPAPSAPLVLRAP